MASSSRVQLPSELFDEYNAALQAAALKTVKSSLATVPSDVAFHRSVHPEYAKDLDTCSARVLSITNKLLSLAATANESHIIREKGKARLGDQEDVVDKFHAMVVDAMDQLLERADISIDQRLGRIKAPAIAVQPPKFAPTKSARTLAPRGRLDPALQHAAHLSKPQLKFRKQPDNGADAPWQHSLLHKYNAQVPLGSALHEEEELATQYTNHPYCYEIKHSHYPARAFRPCTPVAPRSFSDTPFTWVATPEDFITMLDALRQAEEVAVDLEHHDYRSFGGFVCLMQISTRTQDWIVDTLILREELEELNEVFTNPNVVKVFHGAESDIVWLQRDFNLYIVNLFDTYHASKLLDFPRHGLAHLLEMYCDFTADKRYQLADWRIRPLPQEMLDYARSDTHYLLYIYDNLRNALLDRGTSASRSASRSGSPSGAINPATSVATTLAGPNDSSSAHVAVPPDPHALLHEVHARSVMTALRMHQREVYDAVGGAGVGGWDSLARKWNKGILVAGADALGAVGAVQRAVYRAVHGWRDRVARTEDESTRFVLPNHYLFKLAECPPADVTVLLATFHPVPPVVRRRVKELLDVIRAATKEALDDGVAGASAMASESAEGITRAPNEGVNMEVETGPAVSGVATATAKLWSTPPGQLSAPSSTLLAAPPASAQGPFAATQSALLGGNIRGAALTAEPGGFKDILVRVHRSLVIAPTIAIAPAVVSEALKPAEPADVRPPAADLAMSGQIEVAFVPASQRTRSAEAAPEDDAIVVVGQRQRKRKRGSKHPKASQPSSDAPSDELLTNTAPMPAANPGSQEIVEKMAVKPFDYSGMPNMLDEGYAALQAEGQASGSRKKKQRKGKGEAPIQYGEFPAPPRAQNEVRSGNKARTFK